MIREARQKTANLLNVATQPKIYSSAAGAQVTVPATTTVVAVVANPLRKKVIIMNVGASSVFVQINSIYVAVLTVYQTFECNYWAGDISVRNTNATDMIVKYIEFFE